MDYFKDHDSWAILKKIVDKREPVLSFLEGDIWWCNIGVNIGSELDGKGSEFSRMVIVLKKTSPTVFYALPLSSKRATTLFHISVTNNNKTSYAVMSQIFRCSSKRLERRVGTIMTDQLQKLREKWIDIIKYNYLETTTKDDESPS